MGALSFYGKLKSMKSSFSPVDTLYEAKMAIKSSPVLTFDHSKTENFKVKYGWSVWEVLESILIQPQKAKAEWVRDACDNIVISVSKLKVAENALADPVCSKIWLDILVHSRFVNRPIPSSAFHKWLSVGLSPSVVSDQSRALLKETNAEFLAQYEQEILNNSIPVLYKTKTNHRL